MLLAIPAYFARMACLRARRAARDASSDAVTSISSSSSGSSLGFDGVGRGGSTCGDSVCALSGEVREGGLGVVRGDILDKKKRNKNP